MRTATKIWLCAAALLVVLGLALFAAAMTANRWDFTQLNTTNYETNTHEVNESFRSVSMETDTADILFTKSDDGMCRVVCYEQETMRHAVSVQNGTLSIQLSDTREWYDHITLFSFATPKITVYLPESEYYALVITEDTGDIDIPKEFRFESMDISVSTGDVTNRTSASGRIKLSASTGDIRLEDISAQALELSTSKGAILAGSITCKEDIKIEVSTGKVQLTSVTCRAILTTGDTGDISLKDVIAAGQIQIERSTGDVTFERCDAAELFITTDTGNVTGNLLSQKMFYTETSTGDVTVPKSTQGGVCEIKTNTGDIHITVS